MTEELDYLELEEDYLDVLWGLRHLCPICFSVLSLRPMPGLNEVPWHCKNCGTEWPVGELIATYNYNELEVRDESIQGSKER